MKFNTWEETFSAVRDIFAKETQRHEELRTSDRCDEYDERKYARLAEGNVTEVELSSALADLSAMLHKHHGTAPVIIIDEYDTPIQQGYMKGYYEEITLFMRNLFSGGFKDNKHLAFGFLTGILRVAKESIFSGMNNLSINTVLILASHRMKCERWQHIMEHPINMMKFVNGMMAIDLEKQKYLIRGQL